MRKPLMSVSMFRQIGVAFALLIALGIGVSAQGQSAGHAIIGEVRKVDREAGKIVVKTADGTEETLKFTGRTTVHGLKEGGKVTALAGKEGSHVVVHYVGEGAEKTAVGIEYVGKEAPRVIEGTVVGAGKMARTVVVKTPAGAEETLHLTERCMVDTGKGVVKGTEYTAREGERVTAHYSEAGGRKFVHLLKRVGKAL